MQVLGVKNLDARQDGAPFDPAHGRASYLFNSAVAGIEEADAILLVGANPRIEASLVNVRIRKRWRQAPLPIGVIGEAVNLTYAYEYLGAGPETLADLLEGRHSFAQALKAAKRPLLIVVDRAFANEKGGPNPSCLAIRRPWVPDIRWREFRDDRYSLARIPG